MLKEGRTGDIFLNYLINLQGSAPNKTSTKTDIYFVLTQHNGNTTLAYIQYKNTHKFLH